MSKKTEYNIILGNIIIDWVEHTIISIIFMIIILF